MNKNKKTTEIRIDGELSGKYLISTDNPCFSVFTGGSGFRDLPWQTCLYRGVRENKGDKIMSSPGNLTVLIDMNTGGTGHYHDPERQVQPLA
jgi:hypothetical protein